MSPTLWTLTSEFTFLLLKNLFVGSVVKICDLTAIITRRRSLSLIQLE